MENKIIKNNCCLSKDNINTIKKNICKYLDSIKDVEEITIEVLYKDKDRESITFSIQEIRTANLSMLNIKYSEKGGK